LILAATAIALGGGAVVLLRGGDAPEGAHGEQGGGHPGGAKQGGAKESGHGGASAGHGKGAEPGAAGAFQLEPFVLNLADPEGDRFLRVALSVVLDHGRTVPSAADQVRLRDRILTILSSQTADEVTSFEGKEALRRRLEEAIARVLEGSEISDLYFTEFLVQ
jgi:flagellar FliL protein